MNGAIKNLPFFVVLMGLGSISMLVPAAHGAIVEDFVTMRIFFYGAILFSMLSLLVGLATAGQHPSNLARSQLMTLVAGFTILPLMFAVPFAEASILLSYFDAWFEMVSSFTTTGASLTNQPSDLTPSLHLWRATVAWMGGFMIWVSAIAIFAPMNLGGFEVRAWPQSREMNRIRNVHISQKIDSSERLYRFTIDFAPIYIGLTSVLWLGLLIAGDNATVALIHAMSTISTSGISSVGGLDQANSHIVGEVLIVIFFGFALTRLTFSSGVFGDDDSPILKDAEVRVAAILVAGTTLVVFLAHFFGSNDSNLSSFSDAFAALWGALFTVLSYLTTTGFVSSSWEGATAWSGLQTPGLVLVGLVLIGGGVATTAGGVKLLRVYALFRHSEREMDRLLHPSSIGGGGKEARRIRRQGAFISWIFFMLLAISLSAVMVLLSLTGITFENAMVLSIAALSTTGPLAETAAQVPISYSSLPDVARLILAAAMVLGRLEALALIALFNPDFWRK